MKRTLFFAAILVALVGSAASAVELKVVSNKTTYNIGETITLTVSGDDGGLPANYTYNTGYLAFSGGVNTPTGTGQTPVGTGWVIGTQGVVGPNFKVFDQIHGTVGTGDNLSPGGTPFATMTLLAQALGVVNVTWAAGGAFFATDYTGYALGTSFNIVPIPEPTTAALLGLGLVGLVLGGRRRS